MASNDIAERLGIGEEAARSHITKAQVKLGARNPAHAAAEAIRR
jgi:DNA-binding CsgD family transcriptional regulator